MEALVRMNIEKFAGKSYKAGETIPASELGKASRDSIESLVNLGFIEVEGFKGTPRAGGMSSEDREKIDRLQASVDKLSQRLDAMPAQFMEALAVIGVGEKKAPAKKAKAKTAEADKASK